MSIVGKNIQILRMKKRMSQNDLAKKISVSFQDISDYESGKSEPDIDTLVKIADILETDANTLIYGIPDETSIRTKRRQILLLLIVLLFLGVILSRLSYGFQISRGTRLNAAPLLFLHPLILPCYFTLTGWTVMQAAGYFLHARPLSGRFCRIVHILLCNLMGIYCILVLLADIILLGFYTPWVNAAAGIFTAAVLPNIPLIFFILGIALWITKSSFRSSPLP